MWLALTAACGGDPPTAPPADTAPPPVSLCTDPPGGRVGECPGDFTLPTADGSDLTLADHAGDVLIVHLASLEQPLDADASRFVQELIAGLPELIAVDVLTGTPAPTGADAVGWRSALQLRYPVAFDPSGSFGEDWGRTTLFPTLLVLDPEGRVAARIHERYEAQLPDALSQLGLE